MSGFRIDGCGTKEYFTKLKYLGDRPCPNCKKTAPFYLERGKYKISVLYIPTVTLKERYAILCKNCETGSYISDAEAHRLLGDEGQTPNTAKKFCASCGSEVTGAFCAMCGVKFSPETPQAPVETPRCPACGQEAEGSYCGFCGARTVLTPVTTDTITTPPEPEPELEPEPSPVPKQVTEPVTEPAKEPASTWECPLCGTKNEASDQVCTLCGLTRP